MKTLFYIFFFIISISSSGQQDTVFIKYNLDNDQDKIVYTTDTVLFATPMGRHILKGTTVIPWTHNQQIAKGYGFYFDNVTKSDCKKDATAERIPTKINSIVNKTNELIIDINISDNCCYSFLCDIQILNESTINLIYYGYGTYCSCDCCFGLTYKLTKEDVPELTKIKSVMINGISKTMTEIKNTH